MEAVIARGIQALIALAGAYLVALWFVLVVWTYRDIETRSKNVLTQVFSTLLVVLFYIPGVLLYMILRPKETLDSVYQRSLEEEYLLQDLEELPLCLSCQRFVEDDFILCPHCHTTLREPCVTCNRLVHLKWSLCPYCGTEQSVKVTAEQERVVAPAARWRSALPNVPRRRTGPVLVPRTAGTLPDEAYQRSSVANPEHRETVSASAEPFVGPSLTILRGDEQIQSSVRLFDRRKTRATATSNGSVDSVAGNTGGNVYGRTNGNGNGNEQHASNGHSVSYVIESHNGNGSSVSNGHTEGAADNAPSRRFKKREKVGVGSSNDGD